MSVRGKVTAGVRAAAVLVAVWVLGCSPQNSWREEVLLGDGSLLVVERIHRWKVYSEIGGPTESGSTFAVLRVISADTDQAVPEWRGPFLPLVLDRDQQTRELVLVTTTGDCMLWSKEGRPQPPYWEFQVRDGQWVRVPLSSSMLGRPTNLLVNI